MKRFLFMFIALIAMTVTANATDYTGTVSNIVMNSSEKDDISDITFTVVDNTLTGNMVVANAHSLSINATLVFGTENVYVGTFIGTGNGHVNIIPFTCTITNGNLTATTLVFDCDAFIFGNLMTYSFHFNGVAQ